MLLQVPSAHLGQQADPQNAATCTGEAQRFAYALVC